MPTAPAPRRRADPSPTPHEPRLARVAALVADASRARMLAYLLSGEYASASELARAASVSAATASGHLARLLEGAFVVCEQRGRHRYFRLADGEVAQALTALALVAERGSHERAWAGPERARLRHARCCYGHLAGTLGVALLQGLLRQGWLTPRGDADQRGGGSGDDFLLTEAGRAGLAALGVDALALAPRAGARMAYACLDWSERRDHLAGRIASALLRHAQDRRWLVRRGGERALSLTPAGHAVLSALLGDPAPAAPLDAAATA